MKSLTADEEQRLRAGIMATSLLRVAQFYFVDAELTLKVQSSGARLSKKTELLK